MPKLNKILDFLSAAGKITTILLALTPLPTYIGVWGKNEREQIQRVESISFNYLLLLLICNSIWTSYAFKTQNIDLAIISVVPLIVAIILLTIYLTVKPQSLLIKKFFGMILFSQIFNFDLIPVSMCGLLGTFTSVFCNLFGLFFMPDVIKTRDVSVLNIPMLVISTINALLWFLYAVLLNESFMMMSNSLGFLFNVIQLLIYNWAI